MWKVILVLYASSPCLHRRTLADIIMEKLTEKQTEVETVMSEVSGFPMPQLDPRVLEVYRGVREVRDILGYPDSGWALNHGPRQIYYGDQGRDWGRLVGSGSCTACPFLTLEVH